MAFTGASLVLDEKTGFLTSSGQHKYSGFTAALKVKVIEYLKSDWHLDRAAKYIGMNRHTLENHLSQDPGFRAMALEAKEIHTDDVEAMMLDQAKQGKFLPGIAWLRANRAER